MTLAWIFAAVLPTHGLKPLTEGMKIRPDAIYRRTTLREPSYRKLSPLAAVAQEATSPIAPVFGSASLIAPKVETLLPEQFQVRTEGRAPVVLESKKKGIEDTICDVVCSNIDLNGVLSMLSSTTKANLVAVATSDQKLSLSLRRVKLSEALKHISSVIGMTFLKAGSAFLIGPADRLKAAYPAEWEKANPTPAVPSTTETPKETKQVEPIQEETITRTYFCSYTLADGLKQTLKDLYAETIKIAVGPPAVTPTLADRDTAGATGVSQGLLDKDGKPSGRAIVLNGKKSLVLDALDVLKSLDQPRAQVAIQVTIHDIADNALNELGVSWNIGGTAFQESDPKGINFGAFSRTPFNFGATIKALETADKAKILASPNVTVLDGERAFVLIGNKLTLPKFSGYDANKIPMYDTSEYKVGIYLQVAATVSSDGTISLSIYPQVSTVVKTTEINGASYPDIATREAQTSLRVKSGETIVLAGLLRSEEMQQLEQIPILSKIPLFGELFTRRKKTKSSSQVVISLTPTLIPPTSNESR